MEAIEARFIEEFEIDIRNTTHSGCHKYVLLEVAFEDGSKKFEVSYEIDGLADSFDSIYSETEGEARKYIEDNL